QAVDLPVGGRRDLERLPQGLVAVTPVEHEREGPEREPAEEYERRVRDVLKHELREHRADGERAHKGKDGDLLATERDVAGHAIGPVEVRLDVTKAHDRQVRRTESECRGQR